MVPCGQMKIVYKTTQSQPSTLFGDAWLMKKHDFSKMLRESDT